MENIGWIIAFVGAGILLATIAAWRMLQGRKSEYKLQKKMLVLGVSLCLLGAFLMFHGSILGENTTGIATVTGIIGIGIIAGARKRIEK